MFICTTNSKEAKDILEDGGVKVKRILPAPNSNTIEIADSDAKKADSLLNEYHPCNVRDKRSSKMNNQKIAREIRKIAKSLNAGSPIEKLKEMIALEDAYEEVIYDIIDDLVRLTPADISKLTDDEKEVFKGDMQDLTEGDEVLHWSWDSNQYFDDMVKKCNKILNLLHMNKATFQENVDGVKEGGNGSGYDPDGGKGGI